MDDCEYDKQQGTEHSKQPGTLGVFVRDFLGHGRHFFLLFCCLLFLPLLFLLQSELFLLLLFLVLLSLFLHRITENVIKCAHVSAERYANDWFFFFDLAAL